MKTWSIASVITVMVTVLLVLLASAASAVDMVTSVDYLGEACIGDGIYLYDGANYTGNCTKFTADESDLGLSSFNDMAASVKLAGSYGEGTHAVTLYEHMDYQGVQTQFGADDPDLSDDPIGSGNASSLQIIEIGGHACTGDGIYLFTEPDFQGTCTKVVDSQADMTALNFDNAVASVRFVGSFVGSVEAILFDTAEFSGITRSLTTDDADLSNDTLGSARASSIAIWPRTKKWTILLYLAGDGDLNQYFVRSVNDLLRGPQMDPDISVVVLFDGNGADDTWRGRILPGTQRMTENDTRWKVAEAEMDGADALEEFIKWGRANYPAEHYYLAVADHGGGVGGCCLDDHPEPTGHLTIQELRTALDRATLVDAQRVRVDIVHYDACLMGLLENAYDIQEFADYFIAYENLGWSVFSYAQYLTGITSQISPRDFAVHIATQYAVATRGYAMTVSVVDLGKIGAVSTAIDELAKALRSLPALDVLQQVRADAQKFDSNGSYDITDDDAYVDLCDLAQITEQQVSSADVKSRASTVVELTCASTDPLVIYEEHQSGLVSLTQVNLDNAHGTSIFWPITSGGVNYHQYIDGGLYDFTADTEWDEFLQEYTAASGVAPLPDDTVLPLVPMLTEHKAHLPLIIP